MNEPTVRTLRLPGGPELELAERGPRDGPPVLLLHGITDSWRSFEPLLPHLPAHWRLLMPSQRGHGASGKPAAGYRLRDFAADVAALAAALQLEPLLLVGHSMGSSVALRFAADRPACVRGLVGIGSFASYADKPELVRYVAGTVFPLNDPVPAALAHEFQASTLAAPAAPGLLQTMVQESLKVPAQVWRGAFAGLLEDDFGDGLEHVAAPALLLWGDHDVYATHDDQRRLQRRLPKARLTAFASAGHALHWEQPAAVARALAAFERTLPPHGAAQAATSAASV